MQVKIDQISEVSKTFIQRVRNNVNMNNLGLDNAQFFESNAKIEDLKKGLESDSDKDKMDSMKRLIAMMSKGRDISLVFPSVVKNVISKNVELKKLVYMYLVHYAEQEQDNALLAINTFQKDLSNQSQYIRASALRVMSSIRVKIIVQIIVMAIQKGTKDSSAYVRKTAAHAIPKVCAMDPEHKEELIECIKQLLADKATLVLGSAVAAWTEVCPERIDLLHPHFRKLCHLLSDVDEWGQVIILQVLTRYSRSQFVDPNRAKKEKEEKEPKEKKEKKKKKSGKWLDSSDSDDDDDDFEGPVDPDLRLLLDRSAPLLKSRNTAVVLAVSTLYFYSAPKLEIPKVIKSLVRIAKGSREVEYIVLANINTMAALNPELFEPFLVEFFVKPSDATFIRMLKLEIVSNIATQDNINKILKELKTYISREEKEFVAATIQAIGRCAISVPEVADRCLGGLTSMLSNRSETVVAESVVVIKKLLQAMMENPNEEVIQTVKEVLTSLSKLVDTLDSPKARASIVWAIGEYADKAPLVAPDVLRKLAKSFVNEDSSVKLQALNLGAKLQFTNKEQSSKLFEYVLQLAKYDASYDVRDRCRLLRSLLSASSNSLSDISQQLIQTKKPIPQYLNPNEGRQRFVLGSLSHIVNHSAPSYEPIPDFPEEAPDASVRNEQIAVATQDEPDFWSNSESEESESDFYSEESGSEQSGSEEASEEEENSEESEEEESEEESEEEEEESEEETPKKKSPSPSQGKRQEFEDFSDFKTDGKNQEEDFEEDD